MPINSVEELAKWKAKKGPRLLIKRIPRSGRGLFNRGRWILYRRNAKRGVLYVGGLRISWRRPATLAALWAAAWDPGYRAGYDVGWRLAHKMLRLPAGEPKIPQAPKEGGG